MWYVLKSSIEDEPQDNCAGPTDLLRLVDADKMIANPCNPKVGNVKNNGPEMLNSA